MGGVVGDEGDVEEYDAGVDGQVYALPLGQRRRVVRPSRRRSPHGGRERDERGDGGGSVGNETAAVDGAVGPRDKEASAAGGGEEEVQGGGGGGAGGHGRRRRGEAGCCCLWLRFPVSYPSV